MLLCFGSRFELARIRLFSCKLGVLSSDFLKRKRKWAIVLIFIAAAVLTPSPDIVSQLLMALPLLVLYELSVWIVYFFGGKPAAVLKKQVNSAMSVNCSRSNPGNSHEETRENPRR